MMLLDTNVVSEPLRPSPDARGYLVAIAAANGLAVATRDTGAFQAAGNVVINPWQA